MPTVLIGGGSGLIGTRLSELLTEKGYTVWHLSRTRDPNARFTTYHWDAQEQQIDQEAVDGADYIINLAGAGIADQRWSEQRKKVIIDSRVNTTLLLRDAIQRSSGSPKAFLSASGANIYGDQGDQILKESDPPGEGFFAESCLAWEGAVQKISDLGIRTVILRTGVVLSTRGGALPKMTLPMAFFAGVYFGDGRQWMSWIHIDDICRLYIHGMEQERISGVYHGTAPNPERNKDFIDLAAEAKDKAVIMVPAPVFALKIALGEMSHAVLDSVRLSAEKVVSTGFTFNFPELKGALANVIEQGL
jgi:hypothetical protein